jgi:MFS superfamily sulfate permease-like transporter
MLVPKLVTTLRGYNRRQFADDLSAGVVVGIVALPLAIAFARPDVARETAPGERRARARF